MKNKEMKVKAMSMAVAMSMVVGLCPSTIFAATGSQTAKDGTYTKTAHVSRTEDDSDDEWEEYDVEVSLKVEDGKFSEITVTPKEGYDEENASYFNKAYSKSKGFKTKLEGQAATEDTINSWDTVSGATRTSDAIKKAALEAIQSAPVAGESLQLLSSQPVKSFLRQFQSRTLSLFLPQEEPADNKSVSDSPPLPSQPESVLCYERRRQ